ncbi:hypothetical protein CEW46_32060, partial [Bacillus cereus]
MPATSYNIFTRLGFGKTYQGKMRNGFRGLMDVTTWVKPNGSKVECRVYAYHPPGEDSYYVIEN